MLAQNFKSAADLGLTDVQYKALIGVLGMLERNEIQHVEINKEEINIIFTRNRKPEGKFKEFFNMDATYIQASCGTAMCIAGSADHFFGSDFTTKSGELKIMDHRTKIEALFCPNKIASTDWKKITSQQAATALRSYLNTGNPHWEIAAPELCE